MGANHIITCDTGRYPFARVPAEDIFHVEDLSRLHHVVQLTKRAQGTDATLVNADNMAERALLTGLADDSRFYSLYRAFASRVIAGMVGDKVSYSGAHIAPALMRDAAERLERALGAAGRA